MTKRAWNELVATIEEEIAAAGPTQVDDRKLRFLELAYLRDIRDQLAKTAALRPIVQPAPRSSWDVDDPEQGDSGDTRPFRFSDELRAPRDPNLEEARRDKPPKKPK